MGPSCRSSPISALVPRWLSAIALLALVAAAAPLGGCRDFGDVTGSIAGTQQALPTNEADLRAYADDWGKRYDRNPGEKIASINYARALRALTRYSEAAAVMQAAAVKSPRDFEVLGAYGKALADSGEFEQAKDVLSRAYAPERPDWTIMSVQGSVADRLGDHEGAQNFYRDALKIAPGEPSVLSNLGLSYALSKQLPLAEDALREASASPARRRAGPQQSRAGPRARGQVRRGRASQPPGHVGASRQRQYAGDPADDRAERFLARSADRREDEARQGAARRPPPRRLRSISLRVSSRPREGLDPILNGAIGG